MSSPDARQQQYEEAFSPFLSTTQIVVNPISSLSFVFFVYGFYVTLFVQCVYILLRPDPKNRRPNRNSYLLWTVTLFLLASTTVIFHTVFHVHDAIIEFATVKTKDYNRFIEYINGDRVNYADFVTENLIAIVINLIAESMLIYRCYIIWGANKVVAILLIFLSVALNTIGLASTILGDMGYQNEDKVDSFLLANDINNAYAIASAVFNSLLTILTASRIWWITRQARSLMGEKTDEMYRTIVAIVLESGLLYPVTQIVNIILQYRVDVFAKGLSPIDVSAIPVQAAGIAPTLIIVRAAIGKTVETVDQVVSSMRFAGGGADNADNDEGARRSDKYGLP